MPVNHSAGRSVAVAHTAAIPQATLLGKLISPDEAAADADFWSLPINSSHHQAIGIPGSGLIVAARCPQDGVIEAVEAEDSSTGGHFVLGVQWHPERSFRISASSRRMFGRLIEVAGSWRR